VPEFFIEIAVIVVPCTRNVRFNPFVVCRLANYNVFGVPVRDANVRATVGHSVDGANERDRHDGYTKIRGGRAQCSFTLDENVYNGPSRNEIVVVIRR